MNKKFIRFLKLIYSILVIFVITNVFVTSESLATTSNNVIALNPFFATILKVLVASAQVIVTGYFVIRFTRNGIAYFTTNAASDKANNKEDMLWTVLYAVIAYVGMFIFSKVMGL